MKFWDMRKFISVFSRTYLYIWSIIWFSLLRPSKEVLISLRTIYDLFLFWMNYIWRKLTMLKSIRCSDIIRKFEWIACLSLIYLDNHMFVFHIIMCKCKHMRRSNKSSGIAKYDTIGNLYSLNFDTIMSLFHQCLNIENINMNMIM